MPRRPVVLNAGAAVAVNLLPALVANVGDFVPQASVVFFCMTREVRGNAARSCQKKTGPGLLPAPYPTPRRTLKEACRLFDGGADRGERSVQVRADGLHRDDDHYRNAGSNEAVFNGRRTTLISEEARDKFSHSLALCDPFNPPL